jgi:hypothetical protein
LAAEEEDEVREAAAPHQVHRERPLAPVEREDQVEQQPQVPRRAVHEE